MRCLAFVAILVLVAGCAAPSAPGPTTSQPTLTTTVDTGSPTPPPADTPTTVTVTLDPPQVRPSETLHVHAEAAIGSTPVRYNTCDTIWTLRIGNASGPVYSSTGNTYDCPTGPRDQYRDLPAGSVAKADFEWIPVARADVAPGTYTVVASFRGTEATATLNLLGPVLKLTADKANIRPGMTVTVHAVLSNPSSAQVEVSRCAGWTFTVANGRTQDPTGPPPWAYQPPQSPCSDTSLVHLGPGGTLERSFTWDGRKADGSNPPDGFYFLNLDVAYMEGDTGTSLSIHADTSVYNCPTMNCAA